MARLPRQEGPEALLAALTEELARFAGAPHRPFREALHTWAGELWTRWSGAGDLPSLGELERLEAGNMTSIVDVNIAKWRAEHVDRPMAQARTEGVAQGRAEGVARQRAMLRRLAERKFGADTAAELERRLANVVDPDALALVGEYIIDCDTGADLLRTVEDAD